MFFRETHFRGKAALVLQKEFDYDPVASGQGRVLGMVCKEIRKQGGNEFDAAIAFMFVQIDALSSGPSTRQFRLDKSMIANRLSHLAKLPITKETASELAKAIMMEPQA